MELTYFGTIYFLQTVRAYGAHLQGSKWFFSRVATTFLFVWRNLTGRFYGAHLFWYDIFPTNSPRLRRSLTGLQMVLQPRGDDLFICMEKFNRSLLWSSPILVRYISYKQSAPTALTYRAPNGSTAA